MEQASVKDVFDDGPEAEPKDPVSCKGRIAQVALRSNVRQACNCGPPERRNDPPRSLAQRLQEVAE